METQWKQHLSRSSCVLLKKPFKNNFLQVLWHTKQQRPLAAGTLSHAIAVRASQGAELQVQQEGKVIKLQAKTQQTDSTESL